MPKPGAVIGVAVLLLLIALLLAYIGAAQPTAIWDSAKVQKMVSRIGETAARGVFFGLAAINFISAVFIVIKLRTGR